MRRFVRLKIATLRCAQRMWRRAFEACRWQQRIGSVPRASAAFVASGAAVACGASAACLALCALLAAPVMAAPPQFAAVTPGHALTFPADMGAHPAYRTEWWYITGWLDMPDHQPLGFQITFFRSATDHDRADPSAFAPTQLIIAHAAISDPAFGRLVHDQKVARQGFGLAYAKTANTDVKLDNWRMLRAADGHYTVSAQAAGFALDLTFTPTEPPLLQGEQGYSQKGPLTNEASYYYSEPQLRVSGSVVRPSHADGSDAAAHATGGQAAAATATQVTGTAWLDHEWSSTLLSADAVGWDWLGANFPDGAALMAFKVRGRNGAAIWAHATLRDASGKLTAFDPAQVDFVPQRTWRSPRTNAAYPVAETLRTGPLSWQLDPLLDDQEMDTRESTGSAYWEGAVTVRRAGQAAGRGYLELTGYEANAKANAQANEQTAGQPGGQTANAPSSGAVQSPLKAAR